MTLVEAKQEDLKAIAACHLAAFPDSFASKLGPAYLEKMYGWYLANPYTFLYYLSVDGTLSGYFGGLLVGGSVRVGSASGMTQFSFNAAIKALLVRPWLLFHPELLSRLKFILKNFRMKFLGMPNRKSREVEKQAGLVVIAIDPGYQGRGYGSRLLQKFEEVCAQRGFVNLYLSVKKTNHQAIGSYSKNGWVTTEVKGNTVVMRKDPSLA